MLKWIDSASLCSLAGRYESPIPPRFLAPIDFLKIPVTNMVVLPRWESIPGLLKGLHIRALDCCNVCNGSQTIKPLGYTTSHLE
jgi:hypothetical protein